ncbi:type I restriction endonuclease [Planktothrix sp. FACHB-1365]|uniref:type I restriction endonuclease n=1 Tax=Planktothrix sp. FACHB-1365 TaxID=2692855 RepID=UPI0016854CB2|nr:type I restriction endonuclease [Planktothrix sp. FACHB-1365]MBD2485718.1 restriction endonuclease subunit R [Planktothrix sp. FACHB-1365]
MVFVEDIANVAEKVRKGAELVKGEQATKMGLIIPFFSALGYDVFDPTEVIPEFIADFATKKAGQFEKVDYAIAINGDTVMIVEAKARDQKPTAHDGQLKRYFNGLLKTKVAIVTNGLEYRFFTDLRHENVMDDEPFFCFNILNYEPKQIENLKLFHRDNFDSTQIKRQAEEMVYLQGMTKLIDDLLRSPSDDFIRFLVSQLSTVNPNCAVEGRVTSKIIEKFKLIVKKSIQNSLVELMTQSISREMGKDITVSPEIDDPEPIEPELETSAIETTDEELQAFETVKTIAARSQSYKLDVQYKDVVSYFGVNVGKANWWFLRFYLTPKKKSFVTRLPINEVKALAAGFEVQEISASLGDAASRVIISSVNDLDQLSDLILKCYEAESAKHP